MEESRTHPNRLTSNTFLQFSIPSQERPLSPIPALFIRTATCMGVSMHKWVEGANVAVERQMPMDDREDRGDHATGGFETYE